MGAGHEHECPPPPSGSGPGTHILVAIQQFHIISTEVFEMLNLGACAFELLKDWSVCILNKFFYLLYVVQYCIYHIFYG